MVCCLQETGGGFQALRNTAEILFLFEKAGEAGSANHFRAGNNESRNSIMLRLQAFLRSVIKPSQKAHGVNGRTGSLR